MLDKFAENICLNMPAATFHTRDYEVWQSSNELRQVANDRVRDPKRYNADHVLELKQLRN